MFMGFRFANNHVSQVSILFFPTGTETENDEYRDLEGVHGQHMGACDTIRALTKQHIMQHEQQAF